MLAGRFLEAICMVDSTRRVIRVTLKMETTVFSETLGNFRHSTQLISGSRNLTTNCSSETNYKKLL
jgi:hypothetical protein